MGIRQRLPGPINEMQYFQQTMGDFAEWNADQVAAAPAWTVVWWQSVAVPRCLVLFAHVLCEHCLMMRNLEVQNSIVTRLLCESCRIRVGEQSPCPGRGCGRRRYVDALGEPAPLCRECHSRRR